MNEAALDDTVDRQTHTLLLLRWVLIVATAYLLLFHRASGSTSFVTNLFLAAYLASNLVVAALLRRSRSRTLLEMGVAVFDAGAVSLALLVTNDFSADFFLLYFVVILIAAITERLAFVVATAVLISILHLSTAMGHLAPSEFFASGALLRIPFLFVVALFFGHLAERVRSAEHGADEARRNERLITELVRDMIRDFKAPLGAIQAMTEILLEPETGPLTLEQTELLRRVHANTRHLTRVSSNVLEAQKIKASGLVLHREPADLSDVVVEVLKIVRTASDLKGVSLEFNAPAALPRVDVDVNQIDRVVWNLVDNAVRSSPAGGEVTVSLAPREDGVALSVTDDGPGVSAADLPVLFEKFRHVSPGRFTSSGFGLFLAKAVVEAHGGTIDVESEPGGGATFTVLLPIDRLLPMAGEGQARESHFS